jgi:predicted Ser/Thr protein kinase
MAERPGHAATDDSAQTVVDVRRPRLATPCLDDNALTALLDGEVSAEARRDIEAHVDACAACRALVADLVSDAEAKIADGRVAAGGTLVASHGDDAAPPSWVKRLRRDVTIYQTGQMIDHFRILRELGRGGMGEVYLAEDTKLGRRVALKVVSQQHLEPPQSRRALDRFMREARTTARLSHPNIVTIHAVGEHDGKPYLALEYVKGKSLRELMEEGAGLPLTQVIHIAASIAEALVQAHKHGILHRDLKPENVLVGQDGRVRVVDFGLAETVEHVEDTHRTEVDAELGPIVTGIVGTPRYMAPEQWEDQDKSGATDVWALGLIVYELLARRHPFEELRTMFDLAAAVCSQKAIAPLPASIRAPAELRDLCARMLAKDPAERPDSLTVASELARLDRAPMSRLYRARRSPLAWVALAAGALALGALGFFAVSHAAGPSEERAAAPVAAANSQPAPPPVAPAAATTATPVARAPIPSSTEPSAQPSLARPSGRLPPPRASSAAPPAPPPPAPDNPLDVF